VPDKGWRFPSTTLKKMYDEGRIVFGVDETTQPRSKYLLRDNIYENIPSLLYFGGSDTAFLEDLGVPFDTPKVAEVCKEHVLSFTKGDDIVLDFFSGSATVAHGVMLANMTDNGNRKYIMVQVPEKCSEDSALGRAGFKNICEAGKTRIKRSAEKLGITGDAGFRDLKLDTSNMKDVYYNPAEYEPSLFTSLEDNIKEDRTPEDLLFQVMLDLGILLSSKIQVRSEKVGMRSYSYFDVEDGYLIACFDKNIDEEVITAIAKQKPYYFVMRDSSMANDSVATNFEQIFAAYRPDTVRKVL